MKHKVILRMNGNEPAERFFSSTEKYHDFVNEFEGNLRSDGILLVKSFEHHVFVTFN